MGRDPMHEEVMIEDEVMDELDEEVVGELDKEVMVEGKLVIVLYHPYFIKLFTQLE